MNLCRGDIVLVPFPFTDLSDQKVRPAVILTPDPKSSDILIAFISSSEPKELQPTDFILKAEHPDFPLCGLKRTSIFKMNKLLTVQRSLIIRRLGKVSPSIQNELDLRLKTATGLQ